MVGMNKFRGQGELLLSQERAPPYDLHVASAGWLRCRGNLDSMAHSMSMMPDEHDLGVAVLSPGDFSLCLRRNCSERLQGSHFRLTRAVFKITRS